MSSVWSKVDPNLAELLAQFLAANEQGTASAGQRFTVSLRYTGDLAEIEPLGFQTIVTEGEGQATGAVALADVERIAAHPNVVKLLIGTAARPTLDVSVRDIRARTDVHMGLWSPPSGMPPMFTGVQTGPPALIGIIDTGIDFRHRFFRRADGTNVRILRIWDPGLRPTGTEEPPPAARLDFGGNTYGVEYTDAHIRAHIAGTGTVRQMDCLGHGTHVASIAAGNGQPAFNFIGVAPEADLIIAKYSPLVADPVVHRGPAVGTRVMAERLFKDCVTYIRRTADFLMRPVAINYSFGNDLGPHDGFTEEGEWLRDQFSAATGQVFVTSSGNYAGHRQHARIVFTAAGTKTIPVELFDTRTSRRDFFKCRWTNNTQSLWLQVYYRPGGPAITFSLNVPTLGARAGPVLDGVPVGVGDPLTTGQTYLMTHGRDNITLGGGRGVVERNFFQLVVNPRVDRHETGSYALSITSTGPAMLHLWCNQASLHGFQIASAGVPADVFVEDASTIGGSAGAGNILTVASYDPNITPSLPIVFDSSRGPLVRWGVPMPEPKPDLAAPGEAIEAANSRHTRPTTGVLTISFRGTSMAAPHVAGVAALMLAKRPTLTAAQIISIIKARVRGVPPPVLDESGTGRLDAFNAWDNT